MYFSPADRLWSTHTKQNNNNRMILFFTFLLQYFSQNSPEAAFTIVAARDNTSSADSILLVLAFLTAAPHNTHTQECGMKKKKHKKRPTANWWIRKMHRYKIANRWNMRPIETGPTIRVTVDGLTFSMECFCAINNKQNEYMLKKEKRSSNELAAPHEHSRS